MPRRDLGYNQASRPITQPTQNADSAGSRTRSPGVSAVRFRHQILARCAGFSPVWTNQPPMQSQVMCPPPAVVYPEDSTVESG